jgi:hypothetical protein
LEQPDLLEATVAGAFEEAAAAHFPPALLKHAHRPVQLGGVHRGRRGHADAHGESERHHPGAGMWIRLPHHHFYRRHTTVMTVNVTPTIAKQIHGFGATTLEAFLHDHYGITGEVTAPVHIYESLPGATLGRIAAAEKQTPGLGHPGDAWKLQPLTPEVAGLLLGEPGLGRSEKPEFLAGPDKISVGQRFYYLELRDAPPAPPAAPQTELEAGVRRGRSSQVNVRVSRREHSVRVALYLSEADAQEASASVRAEGPAGVTKLLHARLKLGLARALSADPRGHLHWIDDAPHTAELIAPRHAHPLALAHADHAAELARQVLAWCARAVVDHIAHDPHGIVTAAERRADGITIMIHLHGVHLGERHAHKPHVNRTHPGHAHGAPTARVTIKPGFHGG